MPLPPFFPFYPFYPFYPYSPFLLFYPFYPLELVLDDVGEDVGEIEAGGADLLGDEAGDCHARGGVDLQQIDVVGAVSILGDDVVDADDAVAMQDVVDARRLGLKGSGQLVTNAGRGDLIYLTVVLGIVVKELIIGHDLGNGEHD